jgi:hypothetical protein
MCVLLKCSSDVDGGFERSCWFHEVLEDALMCSQDKVIEGLQSFGSSDLKCHGEKTYSYTNRASATPPMCPSKYHRACSHVDQVWWNVANWEDIDQEGKHCTDQAGCDIHSVD